MAAFHPYQLPENRLTFLFTGLTYSDQPGDWDQFFCFDNLFILRRLIAVIVTIRSHAVSTKQRINKFKKPKHKAKVAVELYFDRECPPSKHNSKTYFLKNN